MRENEHKFMIEFGETDGAGIVYFPNYLKWFDNATHHFFRSMNLPLSQLKEKNIILPLIDVRCTFEKSLHEDQWIVVKTTVGKMSTKTIQFIHEIFLNGERVSYGYELRGWVLKGENGIAAQPIPEEIRELMTCDDVVNKKEVLSR
ncbi:acyl-CoA thioesterase [Peribacillus butanolivorans]|uniref:acyl-CoA thioesterase n=1 Tax=Peribacillus butanolivorans TaxID=421767 RepID=UPI00362727B6